MFNNYSTFTKCLTVFILLQAQYKKVVIFVIDFKFDVFDSMTPRYFVFCLINFITTNICPLLHFKTQHINNNNKKKHSTATNVAIVSHNT